MQEVSLAGEPIHRSDTSIKYTLASSWAYLLFHKLFHSEFWLHCSDFIIFLLLLLEDKARRQCMAIDTSGTIGTFPKPPVLAVFNSLQEILAYLTHKQYKRVRGHHTLSTHTHTHFQTNLLSTQRHARHLDHTH